MAGRRTISLTGGARNEGLRAPSGKGMAPELSLPSRPLPGTSLCMALVALAMFLGGGGTTNPQTEMILQVLTLLVMIPLAVSTFWQRGLGPVHSAAWLLAGLVLLIPVLQLIPLPPAIWHILPGRAVEIQSLSLAGADRVWMPLTMAPARTFASLLAMICPVLLMLQVSRLSLRGRKWLCGVIVIGGFLSLLVGILQLSHTGGWTWSLYNQFSEGFLVGFQANRNAQADVLLIAILALGALVSARLADGRRHGFTLAGFALVLLSFLIGLFMTGSRTGIALVVPTGALMAAMFWPPLDRRRKTLSWLGGILVAVTLGGVLLLQLPSVQKIVARFSYTTEIRGDLWADTAYATQQVWPIGSGIGTIVPMLEAAERLDVVDTTTPVRAHNDWLEWTLEGGLPGLIVLGIIALAVGMLTVRALIELARPDCSPSRRGLVLFGCGVLTIGALHSIVDYPLRSMAVASLTAVAVAFLLKPAAAQRSKQ